jgi:hypothetical protein
MHMAQPPMQKMELKLKGLHAADLILSASMMAPDNGDLGVTHKSRNHDCLSKLSQLPVGPELAPRKVHTCHQCPFFGASERREDKWKEEQEAGPMVYCKPSHNVAC